MAIARKPKSHKYAVSRDRAAEQFITGAEKPTTKRKRNPTTLRFDPDLLARIDAAARQRGISRSAWIHYTLSRALDEDDR